LQGHGIVGVKLSGHMLDGEVTICDVKAGIVLCENVEVLFHK